MQMSKVETKCGYIAIIGRPNVGKSTLLNRILGQKMSITSRKPQTTRHQIIGIKTEGNAQAIYVDTPGMHHTQPKAINRIMDKAARSVIADVDVILWVVDMHFTKEEERIVTFLQGIEVPVILVVNKIDTLKMKSDLLPLIEKLGKRYDFAHIVPVAAINGKQVDILETLVEKYLPTGPFIFDASQITDKTERFMVAEIIREKLVRALGQELPYALTVEIDLFKEDQSKHITDIAATIFVERASQKKIVIGKNGAKIKKIGIDARADIEKLIEQKVFLQLWVKVKEGWADDERALKNFGYNS